MNVQKVLIRSPNWIGDHVMASPFYASVRAHFPSAAITLLAPSTLEGLPHSPYFDRTLYYQRTRGKFTRERLRILLALRQERFDLAFGLPFSFSSAFMLRLAGAKRQIAFAERGAERLLTDPVRWAGRSSQKHKSDLYLELCDVFGIPHLPVAIAPRPAPGLAAPIVLAPGASIELRQWPYFAEFAMALTQRFPHHPLILVGSKKERVWAERLSALGVKYRDEIGKTSLAQVVALCEQSALVVANDSGIAHLSATLARASTLILFGPGDPHYILPKGPSVHAVHAEGIRCRPCESATCHARYGEKACLKQLSVEAVLTRSVSLIS